NFEHLLDACSLVSDLLAVCPHLKVLATSRAVLHLAAEHDYTVPPLAVPDPGPLPPLGTIIRYDAVILFVERARAAKAGFSLTGATTCWTNRLVRFSRACRSFEGDGASRQRTLCATSGTTWKPICWTCSRLC